MFYGRRISAFAAAIFLGLIAGAPGAAADPVVASLRTGQSAFWDGAFVGDARVADPNLCNVAGPCFGYGVRVRSAGAKVLRTAIETSDDSNGWEVRLLDPSGNEVASGTTYTTGGIAENYDVEVFASDPKPGLWTVQAIPQNVHQGDFRGRVALQSKAPPTTTAEEAQSAKVSCVKRKRVQRHRNQTGRRQRNRRTATSRCAVPPDIAPDPPWHLTFDQPPPMVVVEGGNYTALAGIHDPTAQVAGQPIYRCLPEETLEDGAQRCLRFTTGFASLGPGPFEVYGSSDVPVATNGGPLHQVVYRNDGSSFSRPAGQFAFHPIHAHYH